MKYKCEKKSFYFTIEFKNSSFFINKKKIDVLILLLAKRSLEILQAAIMNQNPAWIPDHGALTHPFIAFLAHLLIANRKLFILAHNHRFMHLQLERNHEPIFYFNIMLSSNQPVQHILKKLRQILAFHELGGQELERFARADLVRVRIQQTNRGADSNLLELRL